MVFVVLVIIFFSYLAVQDGKLIPNFYQVANEYLLKFVFGIVDKQIVQMVMYMVHFYLSCFYLCYWVIYLVCYLLDSRPQSFGVYIFFLFNYLNSYGCGRLAEHGFKFFKLFVPNVPIYLLLF